MKSSVSSLSVLLCVVAAAMFITATADAQVRYVDKSATGSNNGSSWQNAYTNIQPAIDALFAAGGGQVWVAGGPAGSPVVYNEDRTETWGAPTAYAGSLVMKDNVAVYGGFEGWRGGAGQQETALSQRSTGVNVAVIDGSTSRDGSAAFHVVVFGRGSAATVNARLDGFWITGGNAAGVEGVYHTYRGGGIYNWRSNPVIANCYIYGNTASVSGGGVANEGISGDAAAAEFVNCVIEDNIASRAVDFQNNPIRGGGGVFNNKSAPSLTHCTIAANITGTGGAVSGCHANYGLNSGGIYNYSDNEFSLPASSPTLLSSIVWGNTGTTGILNENAWGPYPTTPPNTPQVAPPVSPMTADYSDIQLTSGTYPGTGNINANPNFSGSFPYAYQITGAPCLDAASSSVGNDLRTVPRPLGSGRDMGAYEYSPNGPSAVCTGHTVSLNASCAATMTAADIDGGSSAQAGIYKRAASKTTFGSADIPSTSSNLTITDRIGRTATCNATVTVNDSIAPVVTSCPSNGSVNANASCVAPAPNLAALVTATDNCGIKSITQAPVAGTNLPLGPNTIQITVTDVGGNAVTSCAPVVTVVDATPPVINTCPPTQTLSADGSCQATVPDFASTGSYADNCGIASVTQNPTIGTTVTTGTHTIVITVTDTAGLTATCNATLQVNDDTNPVITTCPPSQTVPTDPSCNITIPDFLPTGAWSDNCGIASVVQAPAAGTVLKGTQTVTITVQDTSGNLATCTTQAVANDMQNPVAVCMNTIVNLSSPTISATAIDGGSTDNCGITQRLIDGAATRTFTCSDMPSASATLTVRDGNDNSAFCIATVTVVDDMPPIISLNGLSPVTVECGSTYTDAGASATDNCDGTLTPNAASTVDTSTEGSYTVTYTVSDAAGNAATPVVRTVDVVDTTPPAITRNGLATATVECGASYSDAGATASDVCYGDLTGSIATVNPVDTGVPATYTVTYDVTDGAGLAATQVTRTVIVSDNTPPVISLNGTSPTVVECATSYTDAGATATDVCDGSLTPTPTSNVDVNNVGTYTVTYNVTDAAGNSAAPVSRTVQVVDTTAPVINRNGVSSVTVECGGTYSDAGASASDTCEGDLTSSIVTVNPVDPNAVGSYTVTYNVTDASSNAATQVTRSVNVVDTTIPVISLNGANPMTVECGAAYVEPGASAADVCGVSASVDINGTVNTGTVGNYTITYDVTDDAGNDAVQVTRTVNVVDTTIPVISLNGSDPVTVECGGTYSDAGATASDECDGNLTSSISTVNPVNPAVVGPYTVTYDVSDSEGNDAVQVTRTVNVVDTTAPVITRLGNSVVTVELNNPYTDAGATAADDCDGDLTTSIVTDNPVNTSVVGTYTVTYDVTDAQGNAATQVTRTVYVVDTARPYVLSVAVQTGWTVDVTFSKDNMSSSALTALNYVVSGSGQGTLAPSPQSVALVSGGTYRLTWPVTQEMFNGGDITITVNDAVQDIYNNPIDTPKAQTDDGGAIGEAPVITMNAGNETLECGVDTFSEAGASATDNVDGTVTPVIGGDTVDDGLVDVYTVTYTATDAAGNESVESRTVTVEDTTVPVIAMNGTDETVECGDTYTDAGATASDACFGDLTGDISTVNPVDSGAVGIYTVTYDVTDGEGNVATQVTRTVTVEDTTIPVITLLGQEYIYPPLFDSYTDPGATASDACDGNLTTSIVTVNPVDTNTPGFYTVTYNVTDGEGNDAVEVVRYVIVSDTQQPTVASVDVETGWTVLVQYTKDMTGGMGMTDVNNYEVSGSGIGTLSLHPASVETVSGDTYRLVWPGTEEMFNGGDIIITVDPNVEDSAGNFMGDPKFRTDFGGAIGEAPVITLFGSDEMLECGVDTFTEVGAEAEDNVDGPVTVTITGDDLVDATAPGVYLVEYDAVDAAGNAAYDSRTITVDDTADPEIELVGAAALQLECNLENYEEYGASAWDACAGDITDDIVLGTPANTGVLGLQVVSYSVTDVVGNTASVEREVTVVDTTAPVIALLGANPTVLTDGADYVEAGAEAFDECEGDLAGAIVIEGSVGNTNEVATYVLTYTVSDSSANEAAASRTVVVKPEDCELAYELTVDPNPVTPGGTATFTAAPLPENCSAGDIHYLWQKAPVGGKAEFSVIPDAPDAATFVIEEAEFTDAGIYKCTISDASSSADTNEVTLTVTSGVPAAGALGLLFAAAAAAMAGVAALRKRR